MDNPEKPPPKNNRRKRRLLLIISIGVFVVILLAFILYWLFIGRFYVSTDDAYVAGNQVIINPQVESGVVAIYCDNTDLVEAGQILVQLDNSNYLIAVKEKKNLLAETVRQVAALFEEVEKNQAMVEVRRAEMIQAKLNLSHRQALVEMAAVSIEEFEQMNTNVLVAESNYLYAQKTLEASRVLVERTTVETHPRVQDAMAVLRQAYLNLIRTAVLAPTRGYIAMRVAQVGDFVASGATLMTLVPLDFLWVDANFKETQIQNIRIGQKVTFTADIYGRHVTYKGKVWGFSGGTGSAFALLPAQNASGNWIKIVQRLPIRIAIDTKALEENPLFIGLSTRVEVDISDTSGKMLSLVPQVDPVYTTFIYECQAEQLKKFETEILEIIKENNTIRNETDNSCRAFEGL
jgi:membrane fusion protein (multidrug efflux system)